MNQPLRFISLFAGIGGLDLGFERAGLRCVAQVEIDPFCQKVLTKHWPEVPKYGDIKTVKGIDLPECDVLAGGFPCQDIALQGPGAGLDGARSGLWSEYDRLIGEIRPKYVVVENVAALLGRGISRVLGDLSTRGYDAEWRVIRGWDFGLARRRERVFIIAYPRSMRLQRGIAFREIKRTQALSQASFWRNVPEPVVPGGNNGVSDRVGRSKGAGNAVAVPVAEYVANCVKRHAEL